MARPRVPDIKNPGVRPLPEILVTGDIPSAGFHQRRIRGAEKNDMSLAEFDSAAVHTWFPHAAPEKKKIHCLGPVQSAEESPGTIAEPKVLLEVFPIYLSEGKPYVLIPRDQESWQFPLRISEPANDLVLGRLVSIPLEPEVVHSTSWRQDHENLLLTYIAVVRHPKKIPRGFKALPVGHPGIARGGATSPPPNIPTEAVIHHALQHLAWIYQTDPVIKDTLPDSWKEALKHSSRSPLCFLRVSRGECDSPSYRFLIVGWNVYSLILLPAAVDRQTSVC